MKSFQTSLAIVFMKYKRRSRKSLSGGVSLGAWNEMFVMLLLLRFRYSSHVNKNVHTDEQVDILLETRSALLRCFA